MFRFDSFVSSFDVVAGKSRFTLDTANSAVHILARCKLAGQTGVEMEALTAVSVAALTIYDMCKAVDKGMIVSDIKLLDKIWWPLGQLGRGRIIAMIKILFFAKYRELLGLGQMSVELHSTTTVADLKSRLVKEGATTGRRLYWPTIPYAPSTKPLRTTVMLLRMVMKSRFIPR